VLLARRPSVRPRRLPGPGRARAVPLLAAIALTASPTTRAAAAPACPATSPTTAWSGSVLDTGTSKDGVLYETGGGGRLRLQNAAGLFRSTALGISDVTVFAAVADFDKDGWEDFVGVGETSGFVRIYENHTYESPEPNWDLATTVRTPKFVVARELVASDNVRKWRPTAAADFNGDGWPDVFRAEATMASAPNLATVWLNKAVNDATGLPQFKAAYNAMASGAHPADLGLQGWVGSNILAQDVNGDRKIDLVVGSGDNGGTIKVFYNRCTLVTNPVNPPAAPLPLPCANNPTFSYGATLVTGLGFTATAGSDGRLPVFAFGDVDGDGRRDLVVGGPSCCSDASKRLRYYPGLDGGTVAATPQSIAFQGAATVVVLDDFSGDGRLDLIVGTDNWNYYPDHGGESYYWVNDRSSTPFKGSSQKLTSYNYPTIYDFDVGFSFDYDHDPLRTRDVMIADGNHTAEFFVLANRIIPQYVACGTITSGTVDLGALATTELVVTAARLRPTYDDGGGTVSFFVANDEPASWVLATPCPGNAAELCASFPRPAGRTVRWKAEACSNASHTRTPTISGMSATFDYTIAREHFRAGAVVSDGVVYLGGFQQPGDRGHLYAINAGLQHTYWDAGPLLDATADAGRRLYTSNAAGTTRLAFDTAGGTALQATMATSDLAQLQAVVGWVRSARFGVGNTALGKSRLGSIETSTPAVLSRPSLPLWFEYLNALERIRFLQFQAAQQGRANLVIVASRDGMIHGFRTTPTAMGAAGSGAEAWAFVPPRVAASMVADYTASQARGTTVITAYPDGSPTLADIRKSDGSYATIAVIGGGNGNQGLVALDVTSTIASDGSVVGPTPLWTAVPGDAEAGAGMAKPVVARLSIGGRERFAVITGTGIAADNPVAPYSKGRIVAAYDAETGRPLWKFRAQCALTSDVVAFETDDLLEPARPNFDGFVDRVVFADACGYLYKLDPARDLGGDWNDNTGLGTIAVEPAGGAEAVPQLARFSTAFTAGALGTASPIAGTIAAQHDSTGRMILFFGTGGLESHPVGTSNQFYALHADDGSLRSRFTGACVNGRCEKFYGGIVVSRDEVVFTRTIDPAIGSGTCDPGSTTVQAVALDGGADDAFAAGASRVLASAIMGGLYGDAGAVYFANLDGTVSRIGTPRAAEAGGDSAHPEQVPELGAAYDNPDAAGPPDGGRPT
jgi:hypothetical protein